MAENPRTRNELEYRTLCDAIFARLRADILSGRLKPGQKLQQTQLAERFGVSRMPIRDALRKLEVEGLVTVYPERGAHVSVLDLDEFRELYRIRETLEMLAARLAAPNLLDEDVERLSAIVADVEQASQQRDIATWLEQDYKFHLSAFRSCNSPRLLGLIDSLWNSTHHFRRAYCLLPGAAARAEEVHRRMLEALADRDGERFARLTAEHIKDSLREILEAQARNPDGPSAVTAPPKSDDSN